jgi:hypothetical protein
MHPKETGCGLNLYIYKQQALVLTAINLFHKVENFFPNDYWYVEHGYFMVS